MTPLGRLRVNNKEKVLEVTSVERKTCVACSLAQELVLHVQTMRTCRLWEYGVSDTVKYTNRNTLLHNK